MICCRCQSSLNLEEALGGKYGGVVCYNHRVCPDCWWNSDEISINKEYRKEENKETKHIALVNNPRKNQTIKCYGCLYKIGNYNIVNIINYKGSGKTDDPVIIN